jgi:hypothetical protein
MDDRVERAGCANLGGIIHNLLRHLFHLVTKSRFPTKSPNGFRNGRFDDVEQIVWRRFADRTKRDSEHLSQFAGAGLREPYPGAVQDHPDVTSQAQAFA